MSNYDITVLYAYRDSKENKIADFPAQTFPADKIEIIPVEENNLIFPRQNSLSAVKNAAGKYIIFLDEGDIFEPTFLESLFQGISSSKVSFVMPSLTYQNVQKSAPYFTLTQQEIIEIDTHTSQIIFPMELHGLMFETAKLKEAIQLFSGQVEQEKLVLLHLLDQNSCFKYMGNCSLRYFQPRECNWEYDLRCLTKEWYYEPFEQFLLPLLKKSNSSKNAKLIQFMALHMINIRLSANMNNRNKRVISKEDVPAYVDILSEILQYISEDIILEAGVNSIPALVSSQEKLFLLQMKKKDFSYRLSLQDTGKNVILTCNDKYFGDFSLFPIRFVRLDYEKKCLQIDGEYADLFSEDNAKICVKFDGKFYPLEYNQRYSLTKFFGVTAYRLKTFHVTIPVPPADHERIFQFVLQINNSEYVLGCDFPSHGSRFSKDFPSAYWRFDKYLVYWNKNKFYVVKAKKLLILRKEIALWLQMWRRKNGFYRSQLPVKILSFLLRPYFSRQKIWLFLDKIYKGGDSSEYMYRYAVKQNDNIKKYYLLDKSSSDYERMRKEGFKPLVRSSLKHHLIFLNADMVIASNSTVFAFNDYTFERSLPIRCDVHFDVACVQHGMSVQKIAVAQQRLRDNTRLYFCASKYEIKNLSKPIYDYMGYDALKLTGVPRYDGLVNRAQKIIVISPTWRMQSALPVTKSEGFSRDYNPNFKDTPYYKVYNSLINDPRLLENAKKYGYRIQYVLHPIISPQHNDFVKNDMVEIIPSIGDMSYEKIFCEGALMVTDFSGVQFDFAYMRKPVVYLHHRDIPQHYEEGTFFYDTMGFGEICRSNEELIDVLCNYMKNDCQMPDIYRKRADDFFAFSDNHNCERIYPIMLEHEMCR